jgi:alpha-D-ribose 1-methylphosphonate 5-triphosphate synthase subunit PhnI
MPIRSPDPQKLEEAAERLAMSVEKVMQETGISAQELEALFDLSAKNTTVDTDADRR